MARELIATAGNDERNLVVERLEDGRFSVTIEGSERIVDSVEVTEGTWSLIVDGRMVVLTGVPEDESAPCVAALDIESGETVWTAVPGEPAYASPVLMTLAGTPQIVVSTGRHVIGLSPTDLDALAERGTV